MKQNKEISISEVIEKFRKEYRKAYEGILCEEVLNDGNPWFENFINESITSILDSIPCEEIKKIPTPTEYEKGIMDWDKVKCLEIREHIKKLKK